MCGRVQRRFGTSALTWALIPRPKPNWEELHHHLWSWFRSSVGCPQLSCHANVFFFSGFMRFLTWNQWLLMFLSLIQDGNPQIHGQGPAGHWSCSWKTQWGPFSVIRCIKYCSEYLPVLFRISHYAPLIWMHPQVHERHLQTLILCLCVWYIWGSFSLCQTKKCLKISLCQSVKISPALNNGRGCVSVLDSAIILVFSLGPGWTLLLCYSFGAFDSMDTQTSHAVR